MNDQFSLAGKRILVTGGTRGIGRAISIQFARAGASVISNYVRDVTSAQKLQSIADNEGLSLEICRADLTSQKGLNRLVESLEKCGNNLSGLVYCAATGIHRPLAELKTRHFDWTFSLNVRAFFEVVNRLIPMLSHGSSIVALSSQGASRATPFYSLVGSSKAALESLVRYFAAEYAQKGIRANILSAGSVFTDAWKDMPESEQRIADTIRRSPIKRLITAEEVAMIAQFLCSDSSKCIVGQVLVVDGGISIIE